MKKKKYPNFLAHYGVKGMKWGEINWLDNIKASPQLKALASAWGSAYKNYQNTKVAKINGNAKQADVDAAKEKAKGAAVNYKNGLQDLVSKYRESNPDKFNPQLSPEEQAAKEQDEAARAEKKAAKKAEKEAAKKKEAEDMMAMAEEKKAKEEEKAKKKEEAEQRKKENEEKRKQREAEKAQKEAQKAQQPTVQRQTSTRTTSGGGNNGGNNSSNNNSGNNSGNKSNNQQSNGDRRNGEFGTIYENGHPNPSTSTTKSSSNSPKGKTAVSSRKGPDEVLENEKKDSESSKRTWDSLLKLGRDDSKDSESSLGWDSIGNGSIGSMKVTKSILDNIAGSAKGESAIKKITIAAGKIRENKANSITNNKKLKQQFKKRIAKKEAKERAKQYNNFIKAVKNS